jgi:hypothetical protein
MMVGLTGHKYYEDWRSTIARRLQSSMKIGQLVSMKTGNGMADKRTSLQEYKNKYLQ